MSCVLQGPNFENATSAEVEVAIRCAHTGRHALRLQAIRALALGLSREAVALFCQVTVRQVARWIGAFNRGGIDALLDRTRTGRPRALSPAHFQQEVAPLLEDPTKAGEVHWTGVKLHGYLREKLGVELGYSTLLRTLHEQRWTLRIPRPWPLPPKDDVWEQKREAFLPAFRALLEDASARVFFCDECGIEGDPRPRRQWAKKGSHPTLGHTGNHVRLNVIGAVEPRTGALTSLVMTACDTEVFQLFLDTLAREQPPEEGKTHHLVMDNASWHKAKSLRWHHFNPVYLPPYSPDYNAIERLWLHLKSQWFAGFIARTSEALMERILLAITSLLQNSQILQSECRVNAQNF